MTVLIWSGAALSLVGVLGLLYCVLLVARAKKAGLDDAEMKARLKSAIALNMLAFFISCMGLILVVVGLFLAP